MHEDLHRFPKRPENEPVWVTLAGISYCDATYLIFRPPSNGESVIEYVVKGYGTIQVDNRSARPGPDDLYILPRRTRHLYYADPNEPFTKYFFNVHGPLFPQMLIHYGLDDTPVVSGSNTLPLFKHGLDLITENELPMEQLQDELANVIQRIIAKAARANRRAPDALPVSVRRVKEYITSSATGRIGLDDLVRASGRARSQLNRDFKKHLNTTPYNYLLMHKLEQARILLTETERPVKEIAYELGFSDEYHFSNFFRKKAGVAPTRFRGTLSEHDFDD